MRYHLTLASLVLMIGLIIFSRNPEFRAPKQSSGDPRIEPRDVVKNVIRKISSDFDCPDSFFLNNAKKEYLRFVVGENKVNLDGLHDYKSDIEVLELITENVGDLRQGCTEAICVLKKIFHSEEAAYRVLSIHRKSGYVLSNRRIPDKRNSNSFFRSAPWSIVGIRYIQNTINILPAHFLNLPTLKSVYLVPADDSMPNSSNVRSAGFWRSSKKDFSIRETILDNEAAFRKLVIHEIAHAYDNHRSILDPIRTNIGFTVMYDPSKNDFVTEYAKTSVDEDFADSIAYYMTLPEVFKDRAKSKYELIKRAVFLNKEYFHTDSWNDIDHLVSRNELLVQCLKQYRLFKFSRPEPTEVYLYDDSMGFPVNQRLLQSTCLDTIAASISRNIESQPNFCSRGGQAGVQQYLLKKIASLAYPIYRAGVNIVKNKADIGAELKQIEELASHSELMLKVEAEMKRLTTPQ